MTHTLRRVPLERHGDQLGVVTARAQLGDERLGEHLGASALERHLRVADGDPHQRAERGPSLSASRFPALEPLEPLIQSRQLGAELVGQPQDAGVELTLVGRERLHVPAHQSSENRLRRDKHQTAQATPEAGPGQERPLGADRPEPIELAPGAKIARGSVAVVDTSGAKGLLQALNGQVELGLS